MKQTELIALGLAGVAVYMIFKAKGVKVPGTRTSTPTTDKVTEILDAYGKPFANGWRYFSDGLTIDPSGNYYKDNQQVWTAPLTV